MNQTPSEELEVQKNLPEESILMQLSSVIVTQETALCIAMSSTSSLEDSDESDERLRSVAEQQQNEDTPLLGLSSLEGGGYSYGYDVGEPTILEGETLDHSQVRMVDTTAMMTTTMMDLEGPPPGSMLRNDSFVSTTTALTEVSQYDLDTGTRFASMEQKSRPSFHPFGSRNGSRNGIGGVTTLKKCSSTPHMGLAYNKNINGRSIKNQLQHPAMTSLDGAANDTKKGPFWYNTKVVVAIVSIVSIAVITTVVILVWKGHQEEVTDANDSDDEVDGIMQERKLVFTVSLSATVKLLSAIGLGALAASKKPSPKASHMILDQVAVSSLSRLVFWVFQPCFFLCRVALTIAATTKHGSTNGISRSSLALMPLVALLQISIGSLVAKFVTFFSHRTNDSMSNEERTMIENSKRDAQVCMTFANSAPLPLLFADALFAGGQGGVAEDVTACISFYLLGWSPTFWSYGRYLVGTYGDDSSDTPDGYLASRNACERLWDGIKDFGQQVKKVFAPPIIGSSLGIVIGSIPFLRDSMLESGGILYPLFGAIDTLGLAYLPAVILVLAGSLVGGSKKGKHKAGSTKAMTSLNITTLISILLSRFALAPMASIAVVYILTHVNLLPPVGTRTHAIVSFVMLMEGCMPPAQNSILMLQLEGLSARAENMARTVTLIYVLSVVPVTIWLMCMMGISGVMEFR